MCMAPHGQAVMADPVVAVCCWVSFDRAAVEAHLGPHGGGCPSCRRPLRAPCLVPNLALRSTLAALALAAKPTPT